MMTEEDILAQALNKIDSAGNYQNLEDHSDLDVTISVASLKEIIRSAMRQARREALRGN